VSERIRQSLMLIYDNLTPSVPFEMQQSFQHTTAMFADNCISIIHLRRNWSRDNERIRWQGFRLHHLLNTDGKIRSHFWHRRFEALQNRVAVEQLWVAEHLMAGRCTGDAQRHSALRLAQWTLHR